MSCTLRRYLGLALLAAAMSYGNDRLPDLKFRDLQGKKTNLGQLKGTLLVINFWATWCGPCREEMPMLVEAEKAWSEKGVRFVSVSLDENKDLASVEEFLGKHGVKFPAWIGASLDTLERLRLGNAVPDTLVVDSDGQVVAKVMGQIQRHELDERLGWLAGGRKGVAPPAVLNNVPKRQ